MPRKAIYDTEPTVIVSLRMPQTLKTQLDRYASIHRLTLTELLVDGARLRLEQEDPRWPVAEDERITDTTDITRQLAELTVRLTQLEGRSAPALPALILPAKPPEPPEPDFDPMRFILGPLCEKQHDYHGTGQSVRQIGGKHECRECGNARKLAYKQRQKDARNV